jgi:hypothetical protein
VQGGTFTITNPGIYGNVFGLPIINQPQVAILGIGGIEKRPVVVDDAIAIRSMMYMAMSYDHRIVDGAVADQFLALVRRGFRSSTSRCSERRGEGRERPRTRAPSRVAARSRCAPTSGSVSCARWSASYA